jgi:hypothetical protein
MGFEFIEDRFDLPARRVGQGQLGGGCVDGIDIVVNNR